MNTFADVVDAFGGPTGYALATGRKRSWAKKVKERQSLNAAHFAITAEAAKARGIPITVETLARIAATGAEASA